MCWRKMFPRVIYSGVRVNSQSNNPIGARFSLLLSEVVKANRPAHSPTQVLTECSKSFRNGRENIHDDMRLQACNKVHVVLGEDFQ